MIETRDLYVGYNGSDILHGVSLEIASGEMVGILGPNGSGKTTLINALSGVLKARRGCVLVNGLTIDSLAVNDLSRQMAVAPQKTEISFPFKCFSITLMGRSPYVGRWGFYSRDDRRIALEAMSKTHTLGLAERPITNVSGGEAQMVTIARILAQQTDALLLDEATSNLDICHKMEVFDLLIKINRNGATVISVMHDLNLAALYCNRLIFLKKGEVVLDGPTHEVFQQKYLREIYETDVQISRHPVANCPQAHFIPGHISRITSSDFLDDSESGFGTYHNRRHGPTDPFGETSPENHSPVWRI